MHVAWCDWYPAHGVVVLFTGPVPLAINLCNDSLDPSTEVLKQSVDKSGTESCSISSPAKGSEVFIAEGAVRRRQSHRSQIQAPSKPCYICLGFLGSTI